MNLREAEPSKSCCLFPDVEVLLEEWTLSGVDEGGRCSSNYWIVLGLGHNVRWLHWGEW